MSARPRSALVNQCDKNTSMAGSTTASMTPSRNRSTSKQPVDRDGALQCGEHAPGGQRPEQHGLDTAPLGEAARRHLEQEVADEEQAAQQASLRRRDVQPLGEATGSADRVVRAVQIGKGIRDKRYRDQPTPPA